MNKAGNWITRLGAGDPPAPSLSCSKRPVSRQTSHAHLHRRDVVVGSCDGLLGAQAVLGEHAHRPGARRREEPEPAVLAERHLGHEVAALVEQPRVAHGDRHAAPGDLAFHDLLPACVLGDRYSDPWATAALGPHPESNSSYATRPNEPYSVHDPS